MKYAGVNDTHSSRENHNRALDEFIPSGGHAMQKKEQLEFQNYKQYGNSNVYRTNLKPTQIETTVPTYSPYNYDRTSHFYVSYLRNYPHHFNVIQDARRDTFEVNAENRYFKPLSVVHGLPRFSNSYRAVPYNQINTTNVPHIEKFHVENDPIFCDNQKEVVDTRFTTGDSNHFFQSNNHPTEFSLEIKDGQDLETEFADPGFYLQSEFGGSVDHPSELKINSLTDDYASKSSCKLGAPENGRISEELRKAYIQQSKLLPKIRGVWFNSTIRRMGWVGQAYKKCKRIEKIFSISKHGFEGARQLAIAFRNSQKPTNKCIDDDVTIPDEDVFSETNIKDVIKPISELIIEEKHTSDTSTISDNVTEYSKSIQVYDGEVQDTVDNESIEDENTDDEIIPEDEIPIDMEYYNELLQKYKTHLSGQEKTLRDHICKETLLFMLYELEALVELDIPVPPISKDACRKGIKYHISSLEGTKSKEDILPYVNAIGHYVCRGIMPTDMAFSELYTLLLTFSHCKPLKMDFTDSNDQSHVFAELREFVSIADFIKTDNNQQESIIAN
ncbi:conserved hypothetical protein [Theileria equi strain WA]|uniref:AP2/ERF domain-containing protein n=1 Tax=Theileria equi strain WA TaxID=1537102 RepID=L1LGA7_THEEQ|nr:conserved hypothetical protein [Theileria equi strain WA]EKX74299.1 conserved hypothetical protein [Theileria equi strain WA]|eukprot:XP_004833751.1 conserved hypothetical protein [Theileria equi strain WA]